jgi:hypothetical protein
MEARPAPDATSSSSTEPVTSTSSSTEVDAPNTSADSGLPGDSTVVGVFESLDEASQAVERLTGAGFPADRISIVGQGLQSEIRLHGFVTAGDMAKTGAGIGAVFGGLFGLLAGVAFLAVPGFGPLIILGPLAAGVVGAAEGAAGTALVGAILGAFMSRQRIPKITEHLRAGRYLVLVHGGAEEAARAQEILRNAGSIEVSQHDHREAAAAAGSAA